MSSSAFTSMETHCDQVVSSENSLEPVGIRTEDGVVESKDDVIANCDDQFCLSPDDDVSRTTQSTPSDVIDNWDRPEDAVDMGSAVSNLVNVVPFPVRAIQDYRSEDSFLLLQQFEGTVVSVLGDEFTARLVDRTNPGNPREIADFSVDELAEDDRKLLAPGAVFYFSIGYGITHSRQRYRKAFVKFRRLPAWSRRELSQASEVAGSWATLLG